MTILLMPLTADLIEQLQRSHDPGQRLLVVERRVNDILITRADGTELSSNEQFEVFARLAMLATEPDRPPTARQGCEDGPTGGVVGASTILTPCSGERDRMSRCP